jgi:HK97 family phage prohead protease
MLLTEPAESLRTQKLSLADPANAELAKRLKLPGGELIRIFCLGLEQEKDADGERPVLVSTDDVDRMGDIVEPDGVDLSNYRKNPVVLWAHDHYAPPIGSSMWIRRQEHGLLAKIRWASTEFAQQIKLLYDEGHLRAWSIGFLVKEWEPIVAKDKDGQERTTGYRYTKSELLEYSAVPVPANPEALSQALDQGLAVGKALREQLVPSPAASAATIPATSTITVTTFTKDRLESQAAQMTIDEQATKIAALEASLATTTEALTKLKNTSDETIRIDIARITAQGAEAVIKVGGVELTRAELLALVRETVDGLIRKRAGVVSA